MHDPIVGILVMCSTEVTFPNLTIRQERQKTCHRCRTVGVYVQNGVINVTQGVFGFRDVSPMGGQRRGDQ